MSLSEWHARSVRLRELKRIRADLPYAHARIFAHRHKMQTCDAHVAAINDIHSSIPRIAIKAFRGFGKSTIAEEGVLLRAALGYFEYGIILGNTYGMAAKRLASIKSEIDQNRELYHLFGDLRGHTWNESKIALANGVVIEIFGARQSIRGAKEASRPDFVLIDDLEDPEWVRSPESIEANAIWFDADFLPALSDQLRTPIRWVGTPLAENCLLNQMCRSQEWVERIYPIKYRNENGAWAATWPAKHPLEDIDALEAKAIRNGRHREFTQEYMCVSESVAERIFKHEMFHYADRRVSWQAVYAVVDPARTTKTTSATTGWAVWSWGAGGRLDVWECGADYLQPDGIIDLLFRLNETWRPVELGFEADGLNDWAIQPIRQAMAQRGPLPLVAVKAPTGKLDFIRGLQSYFAAGAVSFNGPPSQFADAVAQFLTFPRDKIDAPNALAYCQRMRPGEPVYPEFGPDCIFEGRMMLRQSPFFLAMNCDGQRVTAALIQDVSGVTRVLADWVAEGQAVDVAVDIARNAARLAGASVRPILAPVHFDKFRNQGLAQALARVPVQVVAGAPLDRGRVAVKELLTRHMRGLPCFQVSADATWTLRALSAGYAYPVLPGNVVAKEPQTGVYKTLMEGIEAFAGSLSFLQEDQDVGNWRMTADGRKYRSAMK